MSWLSEKFGPRNAVETKANLPVSGEFKNGELIVVENKEFEVGDFSRLEFESKRSEVSIVAKPELSRVKLKMTFHSFGKDANVAQEQLDLGKIAASVSQEGSLIKVGTTIPETIVAAQIGTIEHGGKRTVITINSMTVIGTRNIFISDGEIRDGDKTFDPTGGWVDFEFEVPTKFEGKIATNGDVEISGTRGDLSVDSGSGGLQIRKVSGNEMFAGASRGDVGLSDVEAQKIVASTNSGDISVKQAVGDLRAYSGRGDVLIKNLSGNLEVKASSGDVRTDQISGIVRIKSGRGEIQVGNVASDLDIEAESGDVAVNRAGKNLKVDLRRGDLDVAFVQGCLDVVAGSGDVTVRASYGRFDVKSGRGDVALNGVFGSGNVRSRSGEINVKGLLNGDCLLSTERGDIAFVSDPKSSLRVFMTTDRGDIDVFRSGATVREAGSSRRSQKKIAEIGGLPRFVLTMHSSSGDIELS